MKKSDKILVLGSNGMIGTAVVKQLMMNDYKNVVCYRRELDFRDLTYPEDAYNLLDHLAPDYIFNCVGDAGGIIKNSSNNELMLRNNVALQYSIFDAYSRLKHHIKKMIFLGSSCIYSPDCNQPIIEEDIERPIPHLSNHGYAYAKRMAIHNISAINHRGGLIIAAMPPNPYGFNDDFSINGHVIPSLIKLFFDAIEKNSPTVELYGTGEELREFLFVDDLAEALVLMMNNFDGFYSKIKNQDYYHLNIGGICETSIKYLVNIVADACGYRGQFTFNGEFSGVKSKRIESSRIKELGWRPKTGLVDGVKKVVEYYKEKRG